MLAGKTRRIVLLVAGLLVVLGAVTWLLVRNPARSTVARLTESKVSRIVIKFDGRELGYRQDGDSSPQPMELDVTKHKTEIIKALSQSKFYSGTCMCVDIGRMEFYGSWGKLAEFGFSDHRFVLLPGGYGKAEFRDYPLSLFIRGLLVDRSVVAFNEEDFERQLLPLAKKGNARALEELERTGSQKASEDADLVATVTAKLKDKNINVAREAASQLKEWGKLDYLKGLSKSKEGASTFLAFWFAENGMLSDAITTVHTMGPENFDLSWAFVFTRNPGKTPAERYATYLLIADLLEAQPGNIYLNLLTDTWNSMGVEYDYYSRCMVPKGKAQFCAEILSAMRAQGPDTAKAIREWVKQQQAGAAAGPK